MIREGFYGLVLLSITITADALPTAKLTLKVIDEKGAPLEGAKAGIALYVPLGVGEGAGTKSTSIRGLTDKDGIFTGTGSTQNRLGYSVRKEGYYLSRGRYIGFKSVTGIIGFRRWQPWNPVVEVVLKKKINPIPLYGYNMQRLSTRNWFELPVLNHFVGYDLVARDWVVPHGQGTHRDFLFKLEKHRIVDKGDFYVTLTLKFSKEGDGIQSHFSSPNSGSQFRLPHNAPTMGYESELVINRKRSKDDEILKLIDVSNRDDQNYFFRVRTEKDEKGNIVRALYGKIHGGFDLARFVKKGATGRIRFSYYLNPTPNDTNLEFDTRKNLFTDLSRQEEVSLP